jgi:hypothetical protein
VDDVQRALASGNSIERAARLANAFRSPQPLEWDGIVALYAREISALDESDVAPFVEAWVAQDVEAALAGIRAWPYASKREIGIRMLLESVARTEPDRTISFLDRLIGIYPRQKSGFQLAVAKGWSATDPNRLREYLLELPAGQLGAPLGFSLGMVARHHGVPFMLEWSERLIDETLIPQARSKILRKAARTAARRDPARAAKWVESLYGEEYGGDGPTAVADAWILVSPFEALQWLENEAPPASRPTALELSFGRWLFDDREAAVEWITSVDRTEFHDAALSSLARNVARRSGDEAVELCTTILKKDTRQKCLITVGRIWIRTDAAAAETWLENSDLDEATRESIRFEGNRRSVDQTKRTRVENESPGVEE